jgi:tRNA modification GTPase
LQQGERADVILYVIDGARAVNPDQLAALENLDPEKSLIVLNKTDLPLHPGLSIPPGLTTIHVSAKTGAGEEELCKSILCKALHNTTAWGETAAVVSARHRAILQDASEELEATLQDLLRNDQALWVVCASRLRSTLDQIRRITGDNYHAEMLDLIFSTFCIGK